MSPIPATLGRRLLSLVYEAFLLVGVWLSLVLFPQAIISTIFEAVAPGWLIWLHSAVLLGALYGWLWAAGRQTLAMKTWKLKLVTDDGRNLATENALMHFFWAWPSYGLCGVGIIWAFFDADGKFLHDRLARTRLVSDRTQET